MSAWVQLGQNGGEDAPRWLDLDTGNMLHLSGEVLRWLPQRGSWMTLSERCSERDVWKILRDEVVMLP